MHQSQKTGIRVFSFEYRLAPEHPFPAAFDDAKKAYEYVLGQGYSPGNIIAFGESAGGGLAVSNILRLIAEGKEAPKCLVTISPWSDLTATGQTYFLNEDKDPLLRGKYLKRLADSYVGDDSPLNPYISPPLQAMMIDFRQHLFRLAVTRFCLMTQSFFITL